MLYAALILTGLALLVVLGGFLYDKKTKFNILTAETRFWIRNIAYIVLAVAWAIEIVYMILE